MDTVRDRVEEAVRLLADTSETPRADAEFLMAHLLGVPRAKLSLYWKHPADFPEYQIYVERRLACEPIPYILGEWEFFSLPLKTRAPVLVPRPETEHLVEVVLEYAQTLTDQHGRTRTKILDLCTGSGCVAIAVAKNLESAAVVATDIGDEAMALAAENVRLNALDDRVTLRQGNLFAALHSGYAPFDIICANPPYVEDDAFPGLSATIRLYEDSRALVAGSDGLEIIRKIIDEALGHLVPGGLLAFEMGEGQYDRVRGLLENAGYHGIGVGADLAGIPRIAFARKPTE